MTNEQIAMMLDELIDAAKYVAKCEDVVKLDRDHHFNLRVLAHADRELLELREKLLVTISGALNGAR